MTTHTQTSALDPELLMPAIGDAFRKLSPRAQFRNPVMFVVFVCSILTTLLWFQALGGHGEAPARFILAIALWLWFTLLFANFAYLSVLPLRGIPNGATVAARGIQFATQARVGTATAEVIFGAAGASIVAAAILVSTFGCNNGLILSGARVYWAMARDRLFFARAGTLSAREVPAFGLVIQAIWTSALCLTGTYDQLLAYVIFAQLLFYAATTTGLFVLRKTRPDAERPYKAIGYPVLPMLYILLALAVALTLLLADKTRTQALAGLVIVLIGVPVYFIWRGVAGDTARNTE